MTFRTKLLFISSFTVAGAVADEKDLAQAGAEGLVAGPAGDVAAGTEVEAAGCGPTGCRAAQEDADESAEGNACCGDAVLGADDGIRQHVYDLEELRAGAFQRGDEGVNSRIGRGERVVGRQAGDRVAAAERRRARVARGNVAKATATQLPLGC